jgi:hypothetical protein
VATDPDTDPDLVLRCQNPETVVSSLSLSLSLS